MKRSALIKEIAKKLPQSNIIFGANEKLADDILNLCEACGMLPPFNSWAFHTDGDNANEKSVIYRSWEEE